MIQYQSPIAVWDRFDARKQIVKDLEAQGNLVEIEPLSSKCLVERDQALLLNLT